MPRPKHGFDPSMTDFLGADIAPERWRKSCKGCAKRRAAIAKFARKLAKRKAKK